MLPPVKRVLLYGLLGGVLLALLKLLEYKHFVHAYPTEIYGGLVAVIFMTLVSAAIRRRKPGQNAPAAALAGGRREVLRVGRHHFGMSLRGVEQKLDLHDLVGKFHSNTTLGGPGETRCSPLD
jgi:hypothetical protein